MVASLSRESLLQTLCILQCLESSCALLQALDAVGEIQALAARVQLRCGGGPGGGGGGEGPQEQPRLTSSRSMPLTGR